MLKYLMILASFLPNIGWTQGFPAYAFGRASCESLWIERNQILNVAGYCFETALGQAVFDNGDCTVGRPNLSERALTNISNLEQAELGRLCDVNTGVDQISVHGRYGPLRFGAGGLTLGRWPEMLQTLDVFPDITGRERSCTVMGLSADGDNFLALRSGPDVRYPQIGQMMNGERVFSTTACMGRWCFADSVQTGTQNALRNGWFHVRWCQP